MGKCILLVRVSTERQSFDAQEQELFQLAVSDGYAESDIIAVCEKESGIKLKEEERKGLNTMKELIESDSSINCVYAWEIYRIARKKKVLFSVLDYLTERKIQLVIKDPYLKLLLPSGEIEQNAEMVFTLFAQMAESEMRNKAARFKRAKDDMKKNYRYRGGWLPLGYKKENGYIVIDEEQAAIVRLIFSLYVEGVSSYKMTNELKSRGYEIKLSFVRHILENENYCNGLYPILISKEMWDKKCEIAKANNKATDKSHKIYFASKLIKCECGRSYTASSSVNNYLCIGKYKQYECTNTKGISVNAMDSLLWYLAKQEYALFLASKNQETKQQLIDELVIWEQKLNALDKFYAKIDERLANVGWRLDMGDIDRDTYIARKAMIIADKTKIDNDAINIKSEIDRINNILDNEYQTNEDGSWKSWVDNYAIPMLTNSKQLLIELDKISDERKYDIIHQYIKSVHIEHTNVINKKITVNLVNYIGLDKELVFTYNSRGIRDKAFGELEGFEYLNRFQPTNKKNYGDRKEYFKEYQRKLRAKKKGAN